MNTDVTRREFLATVAAAQGAFVLGFWMPEKAHAQTQTPASTPPGAAWYEEPATPEVNAWIVVAPDDTITIRIAQTELGQGVWTSNAMMVCEELQCDWTKVRPQYASANRDAREKAPAWTLAVPGNGATDPRGGGVPTFGTRDRTGVAGIPDSLYRRMRTNAASSVKACPVYGGDVKRFVFDAVRHMPGVRSAVRFPIPDPALTRGRIFSGGIAVIADSWYQAKTAIDRMPIEWTIPPEHAAVNTGMMRDALRAAIDQPGQVRVNQGDVDAGFARAAKIVEATYSTPYLARARMEPGNATVLVTNDRVDIWIGDQSPQETRFSASKITGIPEQNVYVHLCHLGGGFGRNGNGPQAEHAIMIAHAHRGTPIHMLWTREQDFIGTTYRAMVMARLKAGLDAEGWPIALEVRTCMQRDGFGPEASFDVTSRYHVPSYRYSSHTTRFHVPVGTRRGVGQAAHEFYRESFMDELARAVGKDPYLYRRELLVRTNLPYKADMITALDMAAEMSGWGTPLPRGTARAIALEERGAETDGLATISAMVHTVSISRAGKVRLERVDVAHDTGFGLVNPLSVKKQIEGQIVWFYNDAMHQATTIADGHVVENNFDKFPLSRIGENPPEISIRFFSTGHWLIAMGHDRATSVQAAIGDSIYHITGKAVRHLPYSKHDLTWS